MAEKKRPAPVTVTAILNLVFGLGGLLCSLCCGLGLVQISMVMEDPANIPPKSKQDIEFTKQLWESVIEHVPGVEAVTLGYLVFSIVTSLLLIVSGIGLLGVKRWGRTMALSYCGIVILAHASLIAYVAAMASPNWEPVHNRMSKWAEEADHVQAQQIFPKTGSNPIAIVGQSLCWCGFVTFYPFLVLILMYLPSVRAAFGEQDGNLPPPPGQNYPPYQGGPPTGGDGGYESFPYDNRGN